MGLIDRLLGKGGTGDARAGSAAASSQTGHSSTLGSPQSVRKELARLSVRESLLHNGIPARWIRAEPLTIASPGRDVGVHVRLVVQHWDARLMLHAVALQDFIHKRIQALDPQAEQWLMGLSWQFALEDASACPPLPHPGSWTAAGAPAAASAAETAAQEAPALPTASTPAQRADRAELEKLMGARDAQFGAGQDGDAFRATEPMPFEKTLPVSALEKTQVLERPRDLQATQPMQLDKTAPFQRSGGN